MPLHPGSKHIFGLLDGFRGVAAVCVMIYHYGSFIDDGVLGSSYLAVDLFFVLSGFVIAYAYDERLRREWAWRVFLRARIIRLYPIYIAGSAIGLVFVLVRNVAEPAKFVDWGYVLAAVVRTGLLLPDTRNHEMLTGLFPFDQAAWSLSLELGINLVYLLLFRALTLRVLAVLVACSAAVLAVTVVSYGTIDMGSTAVSFYGGMERCVFGFFTGVLLFRLRTARVRLPRYAAAIMLAIAVVCFAIPTRGNLRIAHDLVAALLVFPMLVWLGGWASHMPAPRFFAWLAAISYPVYIFHTPVVWILDWLTTHMLHHPAGDLRPFSGLAFAAVLIVLSHLSVRYYDTPMRFFLARLRLTPRRLHQ